MLPLALKLEALGSVALSKIQHHFANNASTEDQLQELDNFLLPSYEARSTYTTTQKLGPFYKKVNRGLGVRKLSTIYRITRISHLVSMLNNYNNNFKFIARYSLELDIKKRGVHRSAESGNFLGFACDESGNFKSISKEDSASHLIGRIYVILYVS